MATDVLGMTPFVPHYQMAMHCLTASGQTSAGFELLLHTEASGLLSSRLTCSSLYRTLLEACRALGDLASASRVQEVAERLGLTAPSPTATMRLQNDGHVSGTYAHDW
eukprot:gnl/TRDRNA2_/TRDRNA2_170401_c3_seq1.p1 gnl/TRDRNA2_/TRDRNA2_170401_c3~~gnl/TRDRNA2_/TRDRNA2_170401_c3_seq1.p1  ORF type:complete len:120 (-),score=21.94 gnl/TRDRNA2_/TRDRNA2_170401_c3_seq1:24-347(-)